jgi:hypothetical protein
MSGKFHAPAAFSRKKSPGYTLDSWFSGPENRSEKRAVKKNLAPTGTRTPTPRPSKSVASRYTDCTIKTPLIIG